MLRNGREFVEIGGANENKGGGRNFAKKGGRKFAEEDEFCPDFHQELLARTSLDPTRPLLDKITSILGLSRQQK